MARNGKLRLWDIATVAGSVALLAGLVSAVVGIIVYEGMGGNLLAELAGVLVEVALIFLVLDWIVKRKGRQDWRFAYEVISQRMATAFVDLMRLQYVASSGVARAANGARYPEFVDMAVQHLEDLRSHIEGFSVAFDAPSHQRCRQLEQKLLWMFSRLKRGPNLSSRDDLGVMQRIAYALHEFFMAQGESEYKGQVKYVEDVIREQQQGLNSGDLDSVFKFRLRVQSRLLEGDRGAGRIPSIVDDMDQLFAVRYFVLDYKLLTDFMREAPNTVGRADV